jgi:hypothetical protein
VPTSARRCIAASGWCDRAVRRIGLCEPGPLSTIRGQATTRGQVQAWRRRRRRNRPLLRLAPQRPGVRVSEHGARHRRNDRLTRPLRPEPYLRRARRLVQRGLEAPRSPRPHATPLRNRMMPARWKRRPMGAPRNASADPRGPAPAPLKVATRAEPLARTHPLLEGISRTLCKHAHRGDDHRAVVGVADRLVHDSLRHPWNSPAGLLASQRAPDQEAHSERYPGEGNAREDPDPALQSRRCDAPGSEGQPGAQRRYTPIQRMRPPNPPCGAVIDMFSAHVSTPSGVDTYTLQ